MLNLIYDRTAEDVAAGDAKGSYNNTDLNRVETAVGQLAELLNAAGWDLSLTTKTDWAAASEAAPAQDIPTASDMARYLGNIAAIRHALAFYRTTPAVPDSMDFLTWQKANAIERILADAETLINNMLATRVFSGELYAGEGFGAPSVKDFDGSVAEFGGGIAGVEIAPFVTRISHNGMTAAHIAVTRKNMLLRPYIHGGAYTNRGITFTPQSDGTVTASGTLSGTDQPYDALRRVWLQPNVIYSISHGCAHPRAFCVVYFRNYANTQTITPNGWDVDNNRAISTTYVSSLNNNAFRAKRSFYVNEPCAIEFQIRFSPTSTSQTVTDAVFKPMLYIGGESDDWDTAPTWEQATGEIITIPFGTTVNEGTLNVTTGELTVTQPTAATYQLAPTAVTMLEGYNQIVSDTGAVTFSLKGVID